MSEENECSTCGHFQCTCKTEPKLFDITIKEAEVIKLNPQPGEVLIFKFKGNEFVNDDVQHLGDRLRALFKKNKIVVMCLPKDHDVELTTVQENVTNDTVIASGGNTASTGDCSLPTQYCSNCNCGKKERIEGDIKKNEGKY